MAGGFHFRPSFVDHRWKSEVVTLRLVSTESKLRDTSGLCHLWRGTRSMGSLCAGLELFTTT